MCQVWEKQVCRVDPESKEKMMIVWNQNIDDIVDLPVDNTRNNITPDISRRIERIREV